jgi:hypothetical protein
MIEPSRDVDHVRVATREATSELDARRLLIRV